MKVRAGQNGCISLWLIVFILASDENHHRSRHRYYHCHHSRLHREGHTPLNSGVLVYLYLWIFPPDVRPCPPPARIARFSTCCIYLHIIHNLLLRRKSTTPRGGGPEDLFSIVLSRCGIFLFSAPSLLSLLQKTLCKFSLMHDCLLCTHGTIPDVKAGILSRARFCLATASRQLARPSRLATCAPRGRSNSRSNSRSLRRACFRL